MMTALADGSTGSDTPLVGAGDDVAVNYGLTGPQGTQQTKSGEILSKHDVSDAGDPWQAKAAKVSGCVSSVFSVIGVVTLIIAFTGTIDWELGEYLVAVGFTTQSVAATLWAYGYYGLKSLAHQIDRLRKAIDEELGPEIDRLSAANDEHLRLLGTFETMMTDFNAKFAAENAQFEMTEHKFEDGVTKMVQVEAILRGNLDMLGKGIDRFKDQVQEHARQLEKSQEQLEAREAQIAESDAQLVKMKRSNAALNKSVSALAQGQEVSAALIEEQEALVDEQEALQAEREKLQSEQREMLEQTEALVRRQATETRQLEAVQLQFEEGQQRQQALIDELSSYRGKIVSDKLRAIGISIPPAGPERQAFMQGLRDRKATAVAAKTEERRRDAIETLKRHTTAAGLRDVVLAAAKKKRESEIVPAAVEEADLVEHNGASAAEDDVRRRSNPDVAVLVLDQGGNGGADILTKEAVV